MNGRRSFVKGVGLFSALFAGGAIARTQAPAPILDSPVVPNGDSAVVGEAVDPAVIRQLEEQASSTLSLSQTYGEVAPPEPVNQITITNTGSGYFSDTNIGLQFMPKGPACTALTVSNSGVCVGGNNKKFIPGTENQVNVKMAPGPDGELYLNINGQWKKVLTA